MMDTLQAWDRRLFLFFNSHHHPVMDEVMFFLTQPPVWIPLYILLLYGIWRQYRKNTWAVVVGIVITILLADQTTSTIMKPLFARLRPSHEPALEGLVHLVRDYRGGQFGFASSHAANTFGVAMFFYLMFTDQRRWMLWLFPWALLVSYTRIYLGVHYPGDVLTGALVGIAAGFAGYYSCHRLLQWQERKRKAPTDKA